MASQSAQPAQSPLKPTPAKSEKRLAFAVAIKNGANVSEASRIAGVHRNTGKVWAKTIREHNGLHLERDAIADKSETAEILSAIMRDGETPAPYRVTASAALAKIAGYEAPQRSQIEVRQIPASVNAWLETLGAVDVEARTIEVIDCKPPAKALKSAQSHKSDTSGSTPSLPTVTPE